MSSVVTCMHGHNSCLKYAVSLCLALLRVSIEYFLDFCFALHKYISCKINIITFYVACQSYFSCLCLINAILQGTTNLQPITDDRRQPQPYLLATDCLNDPNQVFLVVDCRVIGEVKDDTYPVILYTLCTIIYATLKDVTTSIPFWKFCLWIVTSTKCLPLFV